MPTATMTSKGQITIPSIVRASLGVEAGDRVEFVQVEQLMRFLRHHILRFFTTVLYFTGNAY